MNKVIHISIALCTCNGEKYIEQQLNSILEQTIKPDEIVVCDDGSTDKTIDILSSLSKKNPGLFKIVVNNENVGTIRNFEKAISATTGDYIFLSDQDDIWYSDKIEKMMFVFIKHPKVLLIFSNGDLIDENGADLGSTLWAKWNFGNEVRERWKNNKLAFKDLLAGDNKVTGATVAFKNGLKNKSLPINVPIGYWHDAWLSLHAAANNGLYYIEESLIQYRIHSNQQIGLPESNRPSNDKVNFCKVVTYEEFYSQIRRNYPKKFKKNKLKSFCVRIYKWLRFFFN